METTISICFIIANLVIISMSVPTDDNTNFDFGLSEDVLTPTEKPTTTTLSIMEEFFRALPSTKPRREKIPRPPVHKEIKERCDMLPTYRLREACGSIAENALIYNMKDSAQAFINKTDENTFYKKNTTRESFRRLSIGSIVIPGEHNCEMKCPNALEWASATKKHERSFSPWGYCDNYDPDRLPQWISYAKCKCRGCMDPHTLSENLSYSSIELKTAIPVLRKEQDVLDFQACNNKKCKESVVEVVIGCYCFLPIIV